MPPEKDTNPGVCVRAVVAGIDLKDVEAFGAQDPYCEVTVARQTANTTVIEGRPQRTCAGL